MSKRGRAAVAAAVASCVGTGAAFGFAGADDPGFNPDLEGEERPSVVLAGPPSSTVASGLLLDGDRRIVAGSLDTDPGGRTFRLFRWGSDGAPGSDALGAGLVVGGGPAADGAAVARTSDGGMVTAVSHGDGTIDLTRRDADGTVDSTFGVAGVASPDFEAPTRLRLVDIVEDASGGFVIAATADRDEGGPSADTDVLVGRVDASGTTDSAFGLLGAARVDFGFPGPAGRNDRATSLAVDGLGRILVAGQTSTTPLGTTDFDAAVARLQANGLPDPSFGGGDGLATFDAAGPDDRFSDVAVAADDSLALTLAQRPAVPNPQGAVYRLEEDGDLDPSFSDDGIVSGSFLQQTGGGAKSLFSTLIFDSEDRVVVGGASQIDFAGDTYSTWGVTRITPAGAVDRTFAPSSFEPAAGARTYFGNQCQNSTLVTFASAGVTEIAQDAVGRYVLAGGCADGTLGVGRILSEPAIRDVVVDVPDRSEAAGHEVTMLDELFQELVPLDDDALQSAPYRTSPYRTSPYRTSPYRTSPYRTSPYRTSPIADADSALRHPAIRDIPLSDVPLAEPKGWDKVLEETPGLAGRLPQSTTLRDVFEADPAPASLGSITFDDLDLARTRLGGVSQLALVTFPATIATLYPAELADCQTDYRVCEDDIDPDVPLLALELQGVPDLDDLYRDAVTIRRAALDQGPALADFLLVDLDLAASRDVARLRVLDVASILDCPAEGCPDVELADLQADQVSAETRSPILGDATLGELLDVLLTEDIDDMEVKDVLRMALDVENLPFELGELDQILDGAELRADDLQTVAVGFEVDCGVGLDSVVLALPAGARFVGSTSEFSIDGGATFDPFTEPQGAGGGEFSSPEWEDDLLDPLCAGTDGVRDVVVRIQAEPGFRLGHFPVAALITPQSDVTQFFDGGLLEADDSRDRTRELVRGQLLAGHIAQEGDEDVFTYTPTRTGQVTFSLRVPDADFDLEVLGPEDGVETAPYRTSPYRTSPYRTSPYRTSDVPTDGESVGTDPGVQQPNTVQDLPYRTSPYRTSSFKRGDENESASMTVTEGDVGKTFEVRVTGFDDETSADPYVLRAKERPVDLLPCVAPRDLGGGTAGAAPDVDATTQTLVLVNEARMARMHGATEVAAMRTALEAYVARPEVQGAVVPVERSGAVRDAYAAWDADPCDTAKANDVVGAINEHVDTLRQNHDDLPALRHVVVVGDDVAMPFARLIDDTEDGNEASHAGAVSFDGHDNSTSRAFRMGMVLSDDPFGDMDPMQIRGGVVYTPDVGLGRLIETPDDVRAQLDLYEANDGRLDPQTADVAGYDFVKDSAEAIRQNLDRGFGDGFSNAFINDQWRAAEARAALNRPGPAIASLNGHYDQYRLQPAVFTDPATGAIDDVSSAQAQPAPGSLLFTVGCHAGLNLTPSGVTDGTLDAQELARVTDWSQAMAARAVAYAANTGYGYGDDLANALSERLLTIFSANLAGKATSVGQAMMFAKQEYVATVPVFDAYQVKSTHIGTMYGLPTFRVGPAGATAAGAILPHDPGPDGEATSELTVDLEYGEEQRPAGPDPDGTVFPITSADVELDGEPRSGTADLHLNDHRPAQPRLDVDITHADGRPVRGLFLEELTIDDREDVDPAVANFSKDHASFDPEPALTDVAYPSGYGSVSVAALPEGRRDIASLLPGELRDYDPAANRGTQRLIEEATFTAYRRGGSGDWDPVAVTHVGGAIAGDQVAFEVTTPSTDVRRMRLFWRPDVDGEQFRALELGEIVPGRWGASATLPAGATRIVEADVGTLDLAGNAGWADKKVPGYTVLATPGDEGGLSFSVSPGPSHGAVHTVSPLITLEGTEPFRSYEISFDGGPSRPYTGPFRIPEPADGPTLVRAFGAGDRSEGGSAAVAVILDRDGPTLRGEPTTAPEPSGWYLGAPTIHWSCADGVTAVASCPADQTVPGEGEDRTVSGTATDVVGNARTASSAPVDIDLTAPVVSGTAGAPTGTNGWFRTPPTIRWTCTDAGSGVADCPPDETVTEQGRDIRRTAQVTDRAGRESAVATVEVDVDTVPPTGRPDATGSPLRIAVLGGRMTGVAGDATSGVQRVEVVYTPALALTLTPRVVAATLACNPPRTGCTWSAPPPSLGAFRAQVRTTDAAGNVRTSDPVTVVGV